MEGLPPIDVQDREARARLQLVEHGVDALIVTSPTNIRWLTGFAGSNATVVVANEGLTLITDSRYQDRAPAELEAVGSSAEIEIARAKLGEAVRHSVGRAEMVGLEADHVSWAQMQIIDSDWLPDQTLVGTTALLDLSLIHI